MHHQNENNKGERKHPRASKMFNVIQIFYFFIISDVVQGYFILYIVPIFTIKPLPSENVIRDTSNARTCIKCNYKVFLSKLLD